LTTAEFEQLAHLLFVATGGMVDVQAPPQGLASQPIYRAPAVWIWHLLPKLSAAGNQFTVAEQEFAPPGPGYLSVEQKADLATKADQRHERLAAEMLERLADHDRAYKAKQGR
jgi:hypothetical protein